MNAIAESQIIYSQPKNRLKKDGFYWVLVMIKYNQKTNFFR